MKKRILGIAIAATLVAPLAAQADIKVSGHLQAEIGSADGLFYGVSDRTTTSKDVYGSLGPAASNGGGPNKVKFNMDESLGNGLSVYGQADWGFNTTTTNGGSNFVNREKFVGFKASGGYARIGRFQGTYKTVHTSVDPFYATGAQARGTGGMSGTSAFNHSGFLDNAIEVGYKAGGVGVALQSIVSETNDDDGSILGSVKFSTDRFTVAGAVANQKANNGGDDALNWKVAGSFKLGGLGLNLQYEDVEQMGKTHLGSTKGGQYVMGSVTYGIGNAVLAAWVGQFMAEEDNMDAMSYAIGGAYKFSKSTMVYAAYIDTDSDVETGGTDPYDGNALAAGIRYGF